MERRLTPAMVIQTERFEMDKTEVKSIVLKAVVNTPYPGDYENTKAHVWEKVLAVHPNGKRDTHIMGIVGNAIRIAWKKQATIVTPKVNSGNGSKYADHAKGPACQYYRNYAMTHDVMPPDDLIASKHNIQEGSIAPYRTFLKEEGFDFVRQSDGIFKVTKRPAPIAKQVPLPLPILTVTDVERIASEVFTRKIHELFD